MSKYIPADKLIAEIERLKEETPIGISEYDKGEENGRMVVITSLQSTITSLQQEQPEKGLDVTEFCKPINPGIAKCVADHWWELLDGKDTEEKQPEVDLEKAYKSYMESRKDDLSGNAVTVNMKRLARHFYELGLNARKK